MKISIISLFLILTLMCPGYCWPEGAPYKMCVSRYPKHASTEQQSGEPPYRIIPSASVYEPNEDIEVILESKQIQGQPPVTFRGFQINARRQKGDQEECVGEFRLPDEPSETNVRLQFWYPEKPGQFNCATHRNKNDKTRIRLLWRSTSRRGYGDIMFRAGVVKDYKTFWSDVKSTTIRSAGSPVGFYGSSTASKAPATQPTPIDFSTSGCGTDVGCVLYPSKCNDLDCDYAITYKHQPDENSIEFQMMGPEQNEYLSLAFSKDKEMGEDDTVTCISSDSYNGIQRGYNPGHYNDHHRNVDTSGVVVTKQDGRMVCSFVRPVKSSLTLIEENHNNNYEDIKIVNKTLVLTDEVNLQLAFGTVYKDSTLLRKHSVQPLVSPSKVNLLQHRLVYANSLPLFIRFHAVLGFLAWITLSGCAMIISRHCRGLLNTKLCNKDLWLLLHWGLACAAVSLTVILIIIVFASVGGWSKPATIHAVFAFITLGLALSQSLAGLLRPDPKSPGRRWFNLAHRVMAVVIQSLAITTIILGTQISLLSSHLSTTLVTTVIVSVVLQIVLALIIDLLKCFTTDDANNQGRPTELPTVNFNSKDGDSSNVSSSNGTKQDAANEEKQIQDNPNTQEVQQQNGNKNRPILNMIIKFFIVLFCIAAVVEVSVFTTIISCN